VAEPLTMESIGRLFVVITQQKDLENPLPDEERCVCESVFSFQSFESFSVPTRVFVVEPKSRLVFPSWESDKRLHTGGGYCGRGITSGVKRGVSA